MDATAAIRATIGPWTKAWFDSRLEHHPEFLRRIEEARSAIRQGRGTRLEDITPG